VWGGEKKKDELISLPASWGQNTNAAHGAKLPSEKGSGSRRLRKIDTKRGEGKKVANSTIPSENKEGKPHHKGKTRKVGGFARKSKRDQKGKERN